MKMQGINGNEIMIKIKNEKPNLPIILIMGHRCRDENNIDISSNAFECLLKPVDIDELIEKIKKAYEKQQ